MTVESKRKRFNRNKRKLQRKPSDKEEGEIFTSDEEPNDIIDSLQQDSYTSHLSVGTDVKPSEPPVKVDLPPETPEWGIILFQLLKSEIRNVSTAVTAVESTRASNTRSMNHIERKMERIEM